MTTKDIIRIATILCVFALCALGVYRGELSVPTALATALASLTGIGLLMPAKEKTVVVSGDK